MTQNTHTHTFSIYNFNWPYYETLFLAGRTVTSNNLIFVNFKDRLGDIKRSCLCKKNTFACFLKTCKIIFLAIAFGEKKCLQNDDKKTS